MLDEKELEQIAEVVKRTVDRGESNDGCGTVIAGVVVLLAIFGAFILTLWLFQ